METIVQRIICLVIGYAFGLLQTGYIYGKLHGIDIRKEGSGNAGTTNALRVLGKKAGVITYAGDMLKAVLAATVVRLIFGESHKDIIMVLVLYCGLGVILGHNFPFYLGFKGGKGIAASSGVIVALGYWPLILLGFCTFMAVTIISRYVSLGSLVMMTGFMVEFIIFGINGMVPGLYPAELIEAIFIVVVITLLAFWRHRANIGRLIHGNERKLWGGKKEN